jgi:hypothetical protein
MQLVGTLARVSRQTSNQRQSINQRAQQLGVMNGGAGDLYNKRQPTLICDRFLPSSQSWPGA